MMKQWLHKNLQGDPVIWFIVFTLSGLSILVVYSATGTLAYNQMEGDTEHYLFKHSSLVLLSWFAIWAAHKIDYRYYSKLSRLVLWLCIPLLFFTWRYGLNINEASRWLSIPFINQAFQPSDLAKLALIVTLASLLAKNQKNIDNIPDALMPMLLWIGGICALIAMTDLSSSILLFATCMLIMFIGRVPVKYLAILMGIGLFVAVVAISIGQRGQTAINRVESFFDNDKPLAFQAEQSYIAIANGGFIRFAPGQSQQKNFLPHPYSDFIYAIIIEEYGLVGGATVLFLYLLLLNRGMRMVSNSGKTYGGLLAVGLSFSLVIQAIVNMAVAVGLLPITGLTLPLVSMGGTSQLFVGLAIGIILSVSRTELDENETVHANLPKNEIREAV